MDASQRRACLTHYGTVCNGVTHPRSSRILPLSILRLLAPLQAGSSLPPTPRRARQIGQRHLLLPWKLPLLLYESLAVRMSLFFCMAAPSASARRRSALIAVQDDNALHRCIWEKAKSGRGESREKASIQGIADG